MRTPGLVPVVLPVLVALLFAPGILDGRGSGAAHGEAQVPQAIAIAHRAHALHPRTATLAWDVVLSSDGCVIIDGNTRWGVGASQASLREGLRPTLARLFPEYWA